MNILWVDQEGNFQLKAEPSKQTTVKSKSRAETNCWFSGKQQYFCISATSQKYLALSQQNMSLRLLEIEMQASNSNHVNIKSYKVS